MDSRTAPGALCPRPARSQPHLGEGAAGGADPGGGRPAAWPAARRVPVGAASQTGPGRGPSGTARRRAGLGGYGQEITWGWRPAGWPARDGAWTAHPPPPPPPPPLFAGGSKRRARVVDRVRSCDEDVPGGRGDEGAGRVGVCTRLAGDTALCRGLGMTLHDARERGHGGSVEHQSPPQVDPGHGAVAPHGGQRHDCARQSVGFGRVHGDGAGDCGGRGRGRVTAAVGVAEVPALEPGADAPGGVGPGVGVNGDRVARWRGRRGPRRGRAGRDGAGRGDEQPAAGRRDGHGCGGQRCADT